MLATSKQIRPGLLYLVHDFFLETLERKLSYPMPIPEGIRPLTPGGASCDRMLRWLGLLDSAVSPPMLRDALEGLDNSSVAEGLLQYFVYKPTHTESDRDKTDLVVTWLYRHPPTANGWQVRGAFAQAVVSTLEMDDLPPMAEHYGQLLREFSFLRDQILEFQEFNQLIDSGLVEHVLDLKASFGETFFNPAVLARVAEYNSYFGARFDELFYKAIRQLKHFAESLQQHSDVMVDTKSSVVARDIEQLETSGLLRLDYRTAQEHFRRVSRLQKAAEQQTSKIDELNRYSASASVFGVFRTQGSGPVENADLHEQLLAMKESLQAFVQRADPGFGLLVPMRHGSVSLSLFEAEAFRSDYGHEKSFRAELAGFLMTCAALAACFDAQIIAYRSKQCFAYQWKPHADTLAYLVRFAQHTGAQARAISSIAEKRGLSDKVEAINASLLTLSKRVKSATELLSTLGSRSGQ